MRASRAAAMPFYRGLLMVPKEIPQDEVGKMLQRFGNRVWEEGGVVREVENLGVRRLASRLKERKSTGLPLTHNYVRVLATHFYVGTSSIKNMDTHFKGEAPVVRHILNRVKEPMDYFGAKQNWRVPQAKSTFNTQEGMMDFKKLIEKEQTEARKW